MTSRTTTLLAALAIVVAVAAAYSNSLSGPFIFDDTSAIRNNATIRSLRSIEVLVPPANVTLSRRPLANLSFAVNYAIGKLAVRSYHVGNLLIHLLAALTLFGIVRRTLLLPALSDRFGGASTGLAAAVALIWALHPLQTESVTYVVQRVESLMGLCYLLALYALIRSAASERPRPWCAASVVACALGLGAKEVIATAPVVLLLYDRAFLSGSFREAFRRRGGLYLGLAATWGVLGAMMVLYKGSGAAGFGISEVTPWRYALTQPGVILYYLRLSFWPNPLCLDYSWPFATKLQEAAPEAIILAAPLAATAWAVVRRPALGFLGAWFFLILAPTSSVMPIKDACFEHRMYLSLAALAAGAVIAGWALIRPLARESALSGNSATISAAVLALGVTVALGCATFRRNADYRTEISIWEDAARKQPHNPRAWSNLGEAYVSASRYDDAIRSCDKALDLKPDYALAYCSRGLANAGLGRLNEAIQDYNRSIELDPGFSGVYNNRAIAYAQAGRAEEALGDFDEAIKLRPGYAEAYSNRGNVCAQLGRFADAVRDYDRAIALDPDFGEAYYNRAIANGRLGRRDDAVRDYTLLLALDPRNATAYNGRGKALANANHPAEAIRDFDQAIALSPRYAEAYYNRGNALDDANRHSEAIQDYDKAIALKPDFAAAYNNRAVAHYEMKAYDKAWADVKMFAELGGKPDPGFLKVLGQAAGPAERTHP
jgi:tetratricopeptide (TPR) repeat protein